KERNPKLQKERRLSVLSEREDEANRLANLRSYRMCRSTDIGLRRSMNTTVELSADHSQFNSDHFLFSRDRPLTSLLIPP
ncbi:unnamed protein product, partial [Adineta steineri]